jgi:hypothetical protein
MGVTTMIYGVSFIFIANWWFTETGDLQENPMLTLMDFEWKFDSFKTHKNSYTGVLYITDTEYGPHAQEIQSFGHFYHKLAIFAKIIG